jgi:hypothetical protein
MKQKSLLILAASIALLASCGTPTSPASSKEVTSSSSSTPSSETTSAPESSSSIPEATLTTLTMLPGQFATSGEGYPVAGETLFSNQPFYLENVMKGSANPTKADGTVLKSTNVDTIQMKADMGIIENSTAFPVRSLTITMLDKTNAYNLAYAQPSLYYGDTVTPETNVVKGTYVAGTTVEGYKTFVGTYTLDKAYSYIRLFNNSSSVEGQTRATTALSITFNPTIA